MASWLEGGLKKSIAKGFKGKSKLLPGTIRRYSYAMDNFGDRNPLNHIDYPFNGIRESFDARYRAQAGIPESDVKVLVLLGSTTVTPQQTDKVLINGSWHEVREVLSIDPAGASASLQCYVIPAPPAV